MPVDLDACPQPQPGPHSETLVWTSSAMTTNTAMKEKVLPAGERAQAVASWNQILPLSQTMELVGAQKGGWGLKPSSPLLGALQDSHVVPGGHV